MKKYYHIKDDRKTNLTGFEAFKKTIKRCLGGDMFSGAISSFRVMLKKPVTRFYPYEKVELDNRYRAVHRLMRFIESENERCIGCGLCEKICISNCIRMETTLGDDGRKKVENYSINLGRCIYCGFCADVCPELAIVHGTNFENAAEQRAYYAHKNDILTPIDKLKEQVEFEGAGSLRRDADRLIKKTPNYYEIDLNRAKEESKDKKEGENV